MDITFFPRIHNLIHRIEEDYLKFSTEIKVAERYNDIKNIIQK